VELVNRRLTGNSFHQYLHPRRDIDPGAVEVHGITNEFLADKPGFEDVVEDFLDYIDGAELIIHNAPFDVGFINHELTLCGHARRVEDLCSVLDTLAMARRMHPGQKNTLDALCRRYDIDNSRRELHGALLDAEILADVYLIMTGGQVALSLGSGGDNAGAAGQSQGIRRLAGNRPALRVIRASDAELEQHRTCLETVAKASGGPALWQNLDEQ
jgi:DNA polymerase-3 subunit epsilon